MLSADFPAWYMVLLFAHISLTVDYSHTSPIPRPGSLIDTNLFQGDILGIDRNSSAEELTNMAKNGIAGEEYRWPKVAGKVCIPYILSKAYDEMQKSAIRTAMRFFARETCVTFIQRTTEPDYLRIYPPAITSCSSHIGRKKKEQVVLLSAYCLHRPGVIQHELMHAIGFYHEQARPDRDDYVEINKANILETDLVQFEKISSSVAFDQDYDFDSVMHYEWNDFAKNRSVWTIRSKPGFESDARFIGQRIALSQTDIRKINLMYQCEGLDLDDGPSTFTESSSSFSNSRHVDFSHSSVIMTTVSSSTSTTTTPRWAFVASSEKSSVRQGCLVNTDFWCWDTSGAEGRCVSSAWLCDGDVDCYEGSDERDCPTARPSATSTTTTTIITAATTSPVLFVRSAETHRAVVTPDKMDANVTRDRGGFLVFAQGPSLWKLPGEDVGETRELSHMSGEYSRAIAVDCVNHYLYWTNDQTGIRRSRYDGSDNHPVVTKAGMRYGLAMDFVSGNMFWVQDNAVLVAKMSHLEAGHKTIISHTEINRFSALAVHPSRG
ncbi:putative Zinc metalloproteinase nas-4 [Hypsibius exemplaris]|uniref:Metalloendopeptidase n=1 Tax=Hypsibius exemplaris TaxID=2072580 RepID=A0A9X6RMI7_HYPEX|nr:putative Zinc metalloproteinase nas-4 [Hypsibius exemplaris]